jgi:hypothetical protein
MDYTPYEGRQVTGWPVEVLVRGETVFRDDDVIAPAGNGRLFPASRRKWPNLWAAQFMAFRRQPACLVVGDITTTQDPRRPAVRRPQIMRIPKRFSGTAR